MHDLHQALGLNAFAGMYGTIVATGQGAPETSGKDAQKPLNQAMLFQKLGGHGRALLREFERQKMG